MATRIEDLNKIALDYHLNENISDMHIENMCQEYFIQWLLKKIKVNSNVLELGYGDGIVTRALFSALSYWRTWLKSLTLALIVKLLYSKTITQNPNSILFWLLMF